jgi:hypothetical protein
MKYKIVGWQLKCLNMVFRIEAYIKSIVNNFPLLIRPFTNSGDTFWKTHTFAPSEVYTSTHLPTKYLDPCQTFYQYQQTFKGL